MSEPFIGQISIFGFTFAPRGWALCNGQIMPIAQNQALFSLLGTQYGGNGVNTFALPNLQGLATVGMGQGTGLSPYVIGQTGGKAGYSLVINEIPSHSHVPNYTNTSNALSPSGALWAPDPNGNVTFATTGGTNLAGNAVGTAGNNQPHENQSPLLVVNFCIALTGIFPSRS